MKRRDLTTEDLDRIGLKALAALRASDDEIERIVGHEDLFEPIRAAIRLRPEQSYTRFSYLRRPYVLAWGMAAATLLVVAMVGVLAFVGRYDAPQQSAENLGEQVLPVELPPARVPSSVLDNREPTGSAVVAAAISVERPTARHTRRPARLYTVARPARTNIEDVGEFQALTYAGDALEVGNAGQIVRVELPRSSLYALGVDLPIENQAATKIKADLLISEDGVMRAVRVVN